MKRSINGILFYYFLICIALATAPFYVWHIKVIYFTVFSFFLFTFWGAEKSALYRISLIFISCFYLCVFSNFYGDTNIFGRLVYLFPLFLYFIRGSVWKEVYCVFWKIYSYVLIPSLIVYFFVVFAKVDLPSFTIDAYNEIKDYNYTAYPFFVTPNDYSNFGINNYRFCGYFDEPGVVGTMSGVLFTVNKCDLKNWKNWPLLLSGIFSFSLFFFIFVLAYVLLWAPKKYKFGVGFFMAVIIVYIISLEDNLFKDLILERLTVEDGELVGNNRTTGAFDNFYDGFVQTERFWFGFGSKFCSTVADPFGASYKHLIVDPGIIPVMLYIIGVGLYYISICGFSKKLFFLFFLFFSLVYQRQFLIFGLQGIFMILSPCYVNYSRNKQSVTDV